MWQDKEGTKFQRLKSIKIRFRQLVDIESRCVYTRKFFIETPEHFLNEKDVLVDIDIK
jgi:hypothetical protein